MRLHASGVCHSDQNAIDGTAETRCPAVLGPRGRRRRRGARRGCHRRRGRRPGRALVAAGVRRVRAVPAATCRTCARRPSRRWTPAGSWTAPSRLSRDGEPVYHYSLLSTFAEHTVVPEASCIPIAADVPFAVAALVGCAVTTGVVRRVAHGPAWPRRPRGGVRLRRRRPVGRDGRGRGRGRAGRGRRRQPGAGAGGGRVRSHRGRRLGHRRRHDRRAGARGVGRGCRPRLRGHRPARGDAGGVPLDPAARPGGADGHPPRWTPTCASPPG